MTIESRTGKSSTSEVALPTIEELEKLGNGVLLLWNADELRGRWSVHYNRRMRTRAGAAWLRERRIDLNPRLLARHPLQVPETLVHELAHLVVYERAGAGAKPHGRAWQILMRRAGLPATRCHQMDISGLRLPRRSYWFLYLCRRCPSWWIQCQAAVRRCPECARPPGWVYRADRSHTGHRSLVKLARAHAAAS